MAPPAFLRVLHWNVHKGNSWDNVRSTLNAQISRDRPHVIVLNEAKRQHGRLDQWAEANGYVCHQEKPRPEPAGKPVPDRGATAVLVDSRFDILSARVVVMRKPWKVFSHDRWHEPRRGWKIRTRSDFGRVKGLYLHGPTNGIDGGNRVAFAEFLAVTRDFLLNKAAGTVSVSVSDQNERLRRLRKWARLFGAKVAGHGVDSCLAIGAVVDAETHGKHGSDHELVRYRLRRK